MPCDDRESMPHAIPAMLVLHGHSCALLKAHNDLADVLLTLMTRLVTELQKVMIIVDEREALQVQGTPEPR